MACGICGCEAGRLIQIGREFIDIVSFIEFSFAKGAGAIFGLIDTMCNWADPFFKMPEWKTLLNV